jgi:hypothetical protein
MSTLLVASVAVGRHGGLVPRVLVGSVVVALCLCATVAQPLAATADTSHADLRQVSADPFTNPGDQHATQVEPDTFAHGRTVVAVFQTGRNFSGGSSDIGFSVSRNGGRTWPTKGFLPSLTPQSSPPGPYAHVSDAAVAYDAAHRTWLISSLLLGGPLGGSDLGISRSTDGGRHWSAPSIIPARAGEDFDKNWIVCDNGASSPFRGHCYSTWDDSGHINLLLSATSVDAGKTWSTPAATADRTLGIGGQPLVQPDGTVIVPTDNLVDSQQLAYRSTDGGATWSSHVVVSDILEHVVAGGLRSSPLPSAEIDGSGAVYVAWQDCRFRTACSANDIVFSRSTDGLSWTAPNRIPINAISGTVDHFIPGLAVDPHSKGARARLALSYYFYPKADCTAATCRLEVGFISSGDAGVTWSAPRTLSHAPMALSWLPATTQGVMVGDYISTSFAESRAVAVFAIASPPTKRFHQSMFAAVRPVTHAADRVSAAPGQTNPVSVAPLTNTTRPATRQGERRS